MTYRLSRLAEDNHNVYKQRRMKIRSVSTDDAGAIAAIYNHYILHTDISFEIMPLTADEMRSRIAAICGGGGDEAPYFVCETDGTVAGYCYAHPWKERHAYYRSMETTVYVAPSHHRKGIGTALMLRLIDCLRRDDDIHALIACITGGNEASCRLHERLGFRKVSHFKEVGYKFGKFIDVTDYELLL